MGSFLRIFMHILINAIILFIFFKLSSGFFSSAIATSFCIGLYPAI